MKKFTRLGYTFEGYCFDGDFDDYGIYVHKGKELVRDIKAPSITISELNALSDKELKNWINDNI